MKEGTAVPLPVLGYVKDRGNLPTNPLLLNGVERGDKTGKVLPAPDKPTVYPLWVGDSEQVKEHYTSLRLRLRQLR